MNYNAAANFEKAKAIAVNTVGPAVAEAREKAALTLVQYGELRANWLKFRLPIVGALIVVAVVAFWAGTHFRG